MKIILLARKLSELQRQFKLRVEADGGIVESIRCVKL
jgi:hypothetical protein